jgi:DNA mismatch repair ATPase MutS
VIYSTIVERIEKAATIKVSGHTMVGFPKQAAETYLKKLIETGHQIALIEVKKV